MNKTKLLKLIRLFFILFILSGIVSIMDFYYGLFPLMFTRLNETYEILRVGQVTVKMPGVPFILSLLTIFVFLSLIKRLFRLITTEINKEN